MALNLDNPEFWLPPLFLSDDSVTHFNNADFLFSDSNSGFSSPVDSSIASTETESDEDEFLAELTRRLTTSTHHIWKPKPNHGLQPCEKADKSRKMPQSTDCNEEVAKITRLQQDTTNGSGCLHLQAPPQKLCPSSVPSKTKHHAYHPSNQRILFQPTEQKLGLSPCAWPPLQQSHKQPSPVAILMNSNVLKRECSGTGVFLPMPRPVASSTPTQTPRKKQPGASKQRIVLTKSQQARNKSGSRATMNNEIRLPQEWTY